MQEDSIPPNGGSAFLPRSKDRGLSPHIGELVARARNVLGRQPDATIRRIDHGSGVVAPKALPPTWRTL